MGLKGEQMTTLSDLIVSYLEQFGIEYVFSVPGGPIGPNAPGEAGETPYDPIYDPERLGEGDGARVDVPGEGEGGPATGETEGGPREGGEALVPYNQVYTDYQAQAASALENSYIPRGLKDYVRAYFYAVDPERQPR